MDGQSQNDPTSRRQQEPAGWPWSLIGGVLIVAALAFHYMPRFVPDRSRARPATALLRPVRISPGLRPADRVPADAGALDDCNVLFVTLDTTRADRIGCYGHGGIRTPVIDGLAGAGVLFSSAFAPTPTTIPSHCSMMTGLYPQHHGARANGQRLDQSTSTLAEVLADSGYACAAFVSAFVLDSRFGLSQGFAHYDDQFDSVQGVVASQRRADATTERALTWLRDRPAQRFFMWVHYFDPHDPYNPPEPFRSRYAHAYEGEIAFADAQLGRLLAAIAEAGLTEETLVVVAADHGESLGQHEELTHGFLIYNATLHVPMIMACGTRLGGGVHVSRNVSLVDIMPTVLSLLNVSKPVDLDGVDLTKPPREPRAVFAETLHGAVFYGWSPLLAVVEGSDKLIFGPDRELYDIKADPFEASDVIESRAERAGALQDRMETLFGSDLDQVAASTSLRLSAEELEKLRALGYTGGAPPTSTTSPPHPRDEMKLMSRVQIAAATGNDGDRAKAIHLLERIISDHPDFTPPYEYLADQYRHQQDYDGAKATLHRYIRIRPADARPLLKLADVHLLTDEIDEAVELQRRALVLNPSHFAATFTLGRLLLEDGQSVEAADLFARALLLHPRDEQLPGMYVDVMLKLGRRDEAESTLRRLIDVDPHLLFVTDALGRLGTAEEVPE